MSILRQLLLSLSIVFLPMTIAAGEDAGKPVTVTLKSGATLTGQLLHLDPATGVEMTISGVTCRIDMGDISDIRVSDELPSPQYRLPNDIKGSQKLTIEDAEEISRYILASDPDLPVDSTITINGVDIKFTLVPGGTFTYGYDGRGSLSNKSEPVHDITLSPYYISSSPLSISQAETILGQAIWSKYDMMTEGYEYEDKDEVDALYNLAYFTEKAPYIFNLGRQLAYARGLPTVNELRETLDTNGLTNVDIASEAQWALAYLRHNDLNDSDVWFPLVPEFVGQIDMRAKRDPEIQQYMLKGLPYDNISAYDNRHSVSPHHFFGQTMLILIRQYDDIRHHAWRRFILAPVRLAFPAYNN